ncbi:MAG: hypothetical protein ACXQS8_03995, partial [Candidatus Helarchaeales archaeon]
MAGKNDKLLDMIGEMKKIIETLPAEQKETPVPKIKFIRDIILDPAYKMEIQESTSDVAELSVSARSEPTGFPKPSSRPHKQVRIEVAPTIEEMQAKIDMSSTISKLKEEVQDQPLQQETEKSRDISTLVQELEETKSIVPEEEINPLIIKKEEKKPVKPPQKREDGIDLVLKLEKAATGVQSEIPQDLRPKLSVNSVEATTREPEPEPDLGIKVEQAPSVSDKHSVADEIEEEEEYLYLPAEYLKEIDIPDEKTLERAKILVEELKKRDLTEEEVIEATGLTAGELYKVIEWLKENELLLVTRKNFQVRYIFPEISVERWNKFILPHRKELVVETPIY